MSGKFPRVGQEVYIKFSAHIPEGAVAPLSEPFSVDVYQTVYAVAQSRKCLELAIEDIASISSWIDWGDEVLRHVAVKYQIVNIAQVPYDEGRPVMQIQTQFFIPVYRTKMQQYIINSVKSEINRRRNERRFGAVPAAPPPAQVPLYSIFRRNVPQLLAPTEGVVSKPLSVSQETLRTRTVSLANELGVNTRELEAAAGLATASDRMQVDEQDSSVVVVNK
jgi:hypothetical protein